MSPATSFGLGILEARDLDRSDDPPAVVPAKVRIRVVVGEQRSLALRQRSGGGGHRLVELVDLPRECGVVRFVLRPMLRIATNERVRDDAGVALREWRIRPQVRVRLAAVTREGEIEDVLVGRDRLRSEVDDLRSRSEILLSEVLCRVLELEAVHEHDVRLSKCHRRTRWWFEGVGIGAFRNESRDLDGVASDAGDDARDR